jgi:subtilase family serine protease
MSVSRMCLCCLIFVAVFASSLKAQQAKRLITAKIDETKLVTLGGNTPPAAFRAENDRGPVADEMRFEHMLMLLKRDPATEARLQQLIQSMHDPASSEFHHWLTAEQVGAEFGANREDLDAIQGWLSSHGFSVNQIYKNGLVVDFSGTAKQIRETFHTEIHNLVLPNGEHHIANVHHPQIPAALAEVVEGAPLHDFFARPRLVKGSPIQYDRTAGRWSRFTVPFDGFDFFVVAPFDFATIYNLKPLWNQGFTGKGVTIATVEDTNLANPGDWTTFRQNFDLTQFKQGNFTQVYPLCQNPGQNGDEIEAALDVEWAGATAPDANIELFACPDTATTSGLDTAILGLLETNPPDIISDSYGLCETITGQTEVHLENFEEELATLEGVTFFIAQGDTGADQCAPVEPTNFSTLGINSGDNTASWFAVDVGGTDFMAQYNQDVNGIPITNYWSLTNNPKTLQSALSYIPEIPWNDGCTSKLIYTDPVATGGAFTQSFGETGFCNSSVGQQFFLIDVSGSGGPSTCFFGTPSIPGVVSGTCQGNPKPPFQFGVPGIPNDGLRDQPDISLFASNGVWGSFYPICLSDTNEGGTTCSAENDAIFLGGGGTSFASPSMAGILGLIEQRLGKQGDANFILYPLAAQQFFQQGAARCNASQTSGNLPAASCVFNDITLGDMDIPCGQNPDGSFYDCHGATSTLIGELSTSNHRNNPAYPATVGYDLATGLGSVNATNLFNAWSRFVGR